MSGDRYYIYDQGGIYFCTFTVIDWIDIFSRKEYRDIIVDSLNYCTERKGLVIYSWVIMTNHIHLIASSRNNNFSAVVRDFKKFVSKEIVKEIKRINESRKEWILDKFSFEAKRTGRANHYKLWQDSNHAISFNKGIDIWQKIDYIHQNPVRAGWVNEVEDYAYSSAKDYAGVNGLVKVVVL